MVTMSEFAGSIAALKNTGDLLKTLVNMEVKADMLPKLLALSAQVSDARDELREASDTIVDLRRENRELKNKLSEVADFKAQKANYALTDLGSGALAQAYKPPVESPEDPLAVRQPPHWLCTHCFDRNIKGYLQLAGRASNMPLSNMYVCQVCDKGVTVNQGRSPGNESAPLTKPGPIAF